MSLGERLKAVRAERTQRDFAAEMNVSTNTYAMYERNDRSPDSDFLRLICQKFGADPKWLLMGETQKLTEEDITLLKECIESAFRLLFHQKAPKLIHNAPKLSEWTFHLYEMISNEPFTKGRIEGLRAVVDLVMTEDVDSFMASRPGTQNTQKQTEED